MLDANRELKLEAAGLTAVLEVNDGTPQGQLDKLRQFGSQSDVAAAWRLGDRRQQRGWTSLMNSRRYERRGLRSSRSIPIYIVRSSATPGPHSWGTDNLAGGKVLGQCAAALLPGGGEYVTLRRPHGCPKCDRADQRLR